MQFRRLGEAVHTGPSHCADELSGSFSNAASLRGVDVGPVSILSLALSCQSPSVFVGNMRGLWMDMEGKLIQLGILSTL